MPTVIFEDPMNNPKPSTTGKAYTHPHVEDYIEIIAGYRTPAGKSSYSIFQIPEPIVSLARYDIKIMESFAEQCHNNIGFTDKQAALAKDLVVKYERQLFKKGVDVTPVKVNPQYRNPIRVIDRSTRVWIEDDIIKIRFPYVTEHIDAIRTESKTSKGSIKWDPAKKYWEASLTEYNLNWVYTFAKVHNFEIDSEVEKLMQKVLATEKSSYQIQLRAATDTLSIDNAEDSLIEYIENNLGGFSTDNLLKLVDNAGILGYSIEKVIEEVVIEAYGTRFWSLCVNKELKADLNNRFVDQIHEVVKYAIELNRFPIFVYEPDLSDKLIMLLFRHFNNNEIVDLDKKQEITENTKLVYTRKIPKTPIKRIPLLISSAGMLFGGDRQVWIQDAEKVVYFTNDVYNKNNLKGRDICKLD